MIIFLKSADRMRYWFKPNKQKTQTENFNEVLWKTWWKSYLREWYIQGFHSNKNNKKKGSFVKACPKKRNEKNSSLGGLVYVYIGGTPAVLDVYMHLHLVAGPQGPGFDPGSAPIGSPMQAVGFCLSAEYTGHRTQFSV